MSLPRDVASSTLSAAASPGDPLFLPVPDDPAAVAHIRRLVEAGCARWGLPTALRDDLLLTVCETVTNALVHGRPPVVLIVGRSGPSMLGMVLDAMPAPPVVRPPREDLLADLDVVRTRTRDLPEDPRDPLLHVGVSGSVAAGRGMLILDVLADDWGIFRVRTGKAVWFRLGATG